MKTFNTGASEKRGRCSQRQGPVVQGNAPAKLSRGLCAPATPPVSAIRPSSALRPEDIAALASGDSGAPGEKLQRRTTDRSRPSAALQDRPDERAGRAGKRSLAEGVDCASGRCLAAIRTGPSAVAWRPFGPVLIDASGEVFGAGAGRSMLAAARGRRCDGDLFRPALCKRRLG
jgi:hypothetical protein